MHIVGGIFVVGRFVSPGLVKGLPAGGGPGRSHKSKCIFIANAKLASRNNILSA